MAFRLIANNDALPRPAMTLKFIVTVLVLVIPRSYTNNIRTNGDSDNVRL